MGPFPQLDVLIAAVAMHRDLPLAPRNTQDFGRTGVKLLDPWRLTQGRTSTPALIIKNASRGENSAPAGGRHAVGACVGHLGLGRVLLACE